jgi:hypothetical protein
MKFVTVQTPRAACAAHTPASQCNVIEKAMAWPVNSLVDRLIDKEGLASHEAEDLAMDMKRFLALVAISPMERLAPPERIDLAWHHFILHTREYSAFCEAIAGKFIHHVPSTSQWFTLQHGMKAQTLNAARAKFGPLSQNWASKGVGCVGGSCSSDCTPCSGSTNCQTIM